jgi:hypothetical protein
MTEKNDASLKRFEALIADLDAIERDVRDRGLAPAKARLARRLTVHQAEWHARGRHLPRLQADPTLSGSRPGGWGPGTRSESQARCRRDVFSCDPVYVNRVLRSGELGPYHFRHLEEPARAAFCDAVRQAAKVDFRIPCGWDRLPCIQLAGVATTDAVPAGHSELPRPLPVVRHGRQQSGRQGRV